MQNMKNKIAMISLLHLDTINSGKDRITKAGLCMSGQKFRLCKKRLSGWRRTWRPNIAQYSLAN